MTMGSFSAAGAGPPACDESLHQLRVLLLGHEEGALEDIAALGGGDLRVPGQQLVYLPHGGVVAVIDLDGGERSFSSENVPPSFSRSRMTRS